MTSPARRWLAWAMMAIASASPDLLQGEQTVGEEGVAPVITSPPQINAVLGQVFTYQITADNNPDTFGAEVTEPGVLLESFDPATGLLSVSIPAEYTGSSFSFNISAENAHGIDEQIVEVLVDGGDPPGNPPVITSELTGETSPGAVFTYQITADNNPDTFGAAVTEPGVEILEINAQTGELRVSIAPNFPAEAFTVTMSAQNNYGSDEQLLEVFVTPDPDPLGDPPVITSTLEIEAVLGSEFVYRITADNNPDTFGADATEPGIEIVDANEQTGEVRVRITTDFAGESFSLFIFAENANGTDEQTVEVLVLERGPAQTFQASVSVQPPRVNVLDWQVVSPFSFRGTLHTEEEETEGRQPGTFSAKINARRITNKQILGEMKNNGLIESVEGTKLVMVGYLGDDTAELIAVNRELEIFEAVPEEIFAVRFGENDQRITAYSGKTIEEEPTITQAGGYEHVVVDWLKEPGTTTHVRLTGIGRFTAKRKTVLIDGFREVYNALSRSASVAGFNSGYSTVNSEE